MAGSTFEIFDSGDDDGAETDPYMIEEDPYMVVTPPPAVAKTDPYMVETPPPAVAYMRSSYIRRRSLQRSHASAQLPDVGGESAQLLLRGCAKSTNDSYIV